MWNENTSHWDVLRLPFRVTAKGSKILVTTQSMRVANIVATTPPYHVHTLLHEDCWALIKKRAFPSIEMDECNDLAEIGIKIAEKCQRLPLAARIIGSVLHCKSDRNEWEFIQDDLDQLWVAEGFIQPQPRRRIEDIGRDYFDILLQRSFLQFPHHDHNNQLVYKMHTRIHELAPFVSGELCFRMDDNIDTSHLWPNFTNARHLSFVSDGNNRQSLELFCKCNRLRTLLFFSSESQRHVNDISYELFLSLHHIRVLNLNYTNISELPDSIGALKHLHYLDVSNTNIEKLLESVTNLHGLETLKLKNCFNFLQLPIHMKNLINLRHPELDVKRQITFMPSNLGNLRNLQTLSAFIVGKEKGQGIEELKNMNFLHGSLCIANLENVSSVKEAVMAS
ncbi:putative disease resistance protein At3g14460 [Prosopis cineraria]|uniref:putative disease resistance protein At3g14460 n=1 Tax=Prosopis cineraria TaxID=364024 RepID=UPI00240F172D|nr:putative disease resistance protein At3g14460 [Prosopis cineraria]